MNEWKSYQRGESNPGADDADPTGASQSGEPVQEAKQEAHLPALLGNHALTSTARTTNAMVVRQEQMAQYGSMIDTYSGAVDRIRRAMDANRAQPAEKSVELLPTLYRGLGALSIEHEGDPLEKYRVLQGLDEVRRRLFEQLGEAVDPDEGIATVNAYMFLKTGMATPTMAKVNELFPHITATEIAFFPLLQEIPEYFLMYGTTYDPRKVFKLFDINGDAKRRVPGQFLGRPHGMTYVLDDFEAERDDEGILHVDPYAIMGITEKAENVETVLFEEEIARAIHQLIPLTISNNQLYERVWKESSESLQVGLGLIAREAYVRVTSTKAPEDLGGAIAMLPRETFKAFERERGKMERQVLRAIVKDEARNLILRADEVVKLVGVLSSVPQSFLEDNPFVGFIQPNGIVVNLFDTQGRKVEECVLSPIHARELVQSLALCMTSSDRENSVVMKIFDELIVAAQTKVYERSKAGTLQLSRIEKAGRDAWENQEIAFQVLPVPTLQRVRTYREMMRRVITSKDEVLNMSLKVGADEAELYQCTLSLLPKELWEHVKILRKDFETRSIDAVMRGRLTAGMYSPHIKSVSVCEAAAFRFPDIDDISQADRIYTILHECGESLWTSLSRNEQKAWEGISWTPTKKKRAHTLQSRGKMFLTKYSKEAPNEDFSEHFAAYVITAEDFRTRMEQSAALRLKYGFIKDLVRQKTGESLEFPKILRWSLAQLQRGWDRQITKQTAEEAICLREEEAKMAEDLNREAVDEVRSSFEQLANDEEHAQQVDEAEIEDPTERQFAHAMGSHETSDSVETREDRVFVGVVAHVSDCLRDHLNEKAADPDGVCREVANILMHMQWKSARKAIRLRLRDCIEHEDLEDILALLKEVDVKEEEGRISAQGIVDIVNYERGEE